MTPRKVNNDHRYPLPSTLKHFRKCTCFTDQGTESRGVRRSAEVTVSKGQHRYRPGGGWQRAPCCLPPGTQRVSRSDSAGEEVVCRRLGIIVDAPSSYSFHHQPPSAIYFRNCRKNGAIRGGKRHSKADKIPILRGLQGWERQKERSPIYINL